MKYGHFWLTVVTAAVYLNENHFKFDAGNKVAKTILRKLASLFNSFHFDYYFIQKVNSQSLAIKCKWRICLVRPHHNKKIGSKGHGVVKY